MTDESLSIERVDAIDARVEPYAWAFERSDAARIADHWAAFTADKPAAFDGRVLLMRQCACETSGAHAIMRSVHFETNFSAFLAWRDFGFPDAGVRNCFSMAALRGSDGAFILAEMGGHTANPGRIYFPAGTPDPGDVVDGRLDLEGSVRRELEEETGLVAGEVALDDAWLLVDAGPRYACMKGVRIDAPAAEAAREINARIARQREPELSGVRVVRGPRDFDPQRMPDFIIAYLRRMFAVQDRVSDP